MAALKEKAEKATPGPWSATDWDGRNPDDPAYDADRARITAAGGDAIVGVWASYAEDYGVTVERTNADFIAAANPETVLALLALLTETAEALRLIASMPMNQRNPDGDEQAAHSMQVVAEDALARLGPLTKEAGE